MIDRDTIEMVVCNILRKYGPDGHVDGYDTITDFIMQVIEGDPYAFASEKGLIDYEEDKTF